MIDLEYEAWKGNIGPGAALRESIQRDNEERMKKQAVAEPQGVKIPADVIELLKSGEWGTTDEGDPAFTMPMTRDRKLYQKTADVLTALGGKWNRKAKATVFMEDQEAEAAVLEALETGTYINSKKLYQFFETPPEVAEMMIQQLELDEAKGSLTFLEPSAGRGALINAVAKACNVDTDVTLTAIELDPEKADWLRREFKGRPSQITKGLLQLDFLKVGPAGWAGGGDVFDRIIMNPPFSRQQDIDHVMHAYKFLKPGGIMVSIMSPSHTFRTNKKTVDFLAWLGECSKHGSVSQTGLPEGSFKVSGTNVRTVMVTIKKKK